MHKSGEYSQVHKVNYSLSFPFPLRFTVDASSDSAYVLCSASSSSCRLPGVGACDPRLKAARFLPLRRTISFSHAFSRRSSFASRSSSSALPVKSETVRSRLSVFSFFLTLNRAMGSLSSQKDDLPRVIDPHLRQPCSCAACHQQWIPHRPFPLGLVHCAWSWGTLQGKG